MYGAWIKLRRLEEVHVPTCEILSSKTKTKKVATRPELRSTFEVSRCGALLLCPPPLILPLTLPPLPGSLMAYSIQDHVMEVLVPAAKGSAFDMY